MFFATPKKTLYPPSCNTLFHKKYILFLPNIFHKNPNNVLLNKLENWVDKYMEDIDFWGIGYVPIFTVYQDSFAGVKRVLLE
jgi:hypothetical protein